MKPTQGHVYTFEQIAKMELSDTPCLLFTYKGSPVVIQTSHVTDKELLQVPGFATSRWRYISTTNEWIPVFEAESNSEVCSLVDIEPSTDLSFHEGQVERWWATPKGLYRKQYVN